MELNTERMAILVDLPHPLRRSRPQGARSSVCIKDATVVAAKYAKALEAQRIGLLSPALV